MKYTKEQFAALINGRQYGEEMEPYEEKQAAESGLVVVFGASDDLMEFRGAIYDEGSVYDGGTCHISTSGKLLDEDDLQNMEDLAGKLGVGLADKVKKVTAVWCPENDGKVYASWIYETDIPHATFDIYEDDGDLYCRGIVFDFSELAK
jgi:hypothetical protein